MTSGTDLPAGTEGPADVELARWLSQVRAASAARVGERPPPDVEALRLPRPRPRGPELPLVADLVVPGAEGVPPVPARLYRPGTGPVPLVVHVHGGAFVFGDLDTHDRTCRRLAARTGAAVLAVAYRLAPEHPAPAGVDDVVRVLDWVREAPDDLGPVLGPPAVAGDSAGGAVGVLAASRVVGAGARLAALLLACPNADLTLSTTSMRELGSGWGLDARDLAAFVAAWLPEPTPEALRRYSPVHADLSADLPPVLLATAGLDPLRDEGEALAGRLAALGVDVTHLPHPGLVHGFLSLDTVSPAARRAGDALLDRFGALLPRG